MFNFCIDYAYLSVSRVNGIGETPNFSSITKICPYNIQIFFEVVKIDIYQQKIVDIFLIFAQNIDCVYTLEAPRRGGSNEYLQSMFWSKNKNK